LISRKSWEAIRNWPGNLGERFGFGNIGNCIGKSYSIDCNFSKVQSKIT
jgi:hypothetical protein